MEREMAILDISASANASLFVTTATRSLSFRTLLDQCHADGCLGSSATPNATGWDSN